MIEPLKVGVVGAGGRMGKAASAWIHEEDGLELVGRVGRGEGWGAIQSATVCLDLTRAGLGAEHGRRLLEMGIRPLIGTSGVSLAECQDLSDLSIKKGLGGAVVPNFSLGAHLLSLAAKTARAQMNSAVIVEAHQRSKADAPSGTAMQLANELNIDHDLITSMRIGGLTGVHEVRLWTDDETLTVRHESLGLSSFRRGILLGLRYASTATGVSYGLAAVLGEACKLEP